MVFGWGGPRLLGFFGARRDSVKRAYNIVQSMLLRKHGYVIENLAATGLALFWARRSGLEWDDLGMDSKNLAKGIALG